MSDSVQRTRQYVLYGQRLSVYCGVPALRREIEAVFSPFVAGDASGEPSLELSISPYAPEQVIRRMPSQTTRVALSGEVCDAYQDGERFWIVDERWGIAELNLIRGTCHAWLLARTTLDAVRCVEQALLWPLAQLLRGRVHLLPAISLERDGRGILLFAPRGLSADLLVLLRTGYRIVGQRWTMVREEENGLRLLRIPGKLDRHELAGLRPPRSRPWQRWTDLSHGRPYLATQQTLCDAIAIIAPARKLTAHANEVPPHIATQQVRHNWPLACLCPEPALARVYARMTRVFTCQLSRRTDDLLVLLDSIWGARPTASAAPRSRAA